MWNAISWEMIPENFEPEVWQARLARLGTEAKRTALQTAGHLHMQSDAHYVQNKDN